jgi:hypothetical protein
MIDYMFSRFMLLSKSGMAAFRAASPNDSAGHLVFHMLASFKQTGDEIAVLDEARNSGKQSPFIARILLTSPKKKETNPRDRIYGILGISRMDGQPIIPDY